MSKVVKKVGKAVKGAVKGIKKVFKKVVNSKLGKIIIIAAAIYYGGAVLGQWSVAPSLPGAATVNTMGANYAAGNGFLNATATAATEGSLANATTGSITGVGSPGASQYVAQGGQAMPAAATGGASQAAPLSAGTPVPDPTGAAPLPGAPGTPSHTPIPSGSPAPLVEGTPSWVAGKGAGGAGNAFSKMAGWIGDNGLASAMGLNAAAMMLSPNAEDLQENRQDRIDDERERRSKNLEGVAGINLGLAPSGERLKYSDGSGNVYRNGLIGNTLMNQRSG